MRARTVFNRPLSAAYRHLALEAPSFPPVFNAGQFVMVRSPFAIDPLLPRAFSIYRVSRQADHASCVIELLYKVLGKGTQCLSRLAPGHEVDLLGPLGNGFTVPDGTGRAILVAGGIGVPPIAALAAQILSNREDRCAPEIEVFLGGRTSEDILCAKDFEATAACVHITTEDGSLGACGLITDLLAPFLRHPPSPVVAVFTCGPPGMLSAVAKLAETHGIACQTSLEASMACGFGACMGCATAMRTEGNGPCYTLVCKDGPVFDAQSIQWE